MEFGGDGRRAPALSAFRRAAVLAGLIVLALAQPAAAQAAFQDWAAVVVAGDWRAQGGGPTEAFDNARRDVSQALERAGFAPDHLRQYSTRPQRYPDTRPGPSDLDAIHAGLAQVAAKAPGGCLFYMTSHGTPDGAVLGEELLSPGRLEDVLDDICRGRPTVVVISACFSGVFVPTLSRANRMVLTAARRDRSSFGCGEDDTYPYFDSCFLSVMPTASDFPNLGAAVQACVARRERETGARPPSEPQMFIGAGVKPILPLLRFSETPSPTPVASRGQARP